MKKKIAMFLSLVMCLALVSCAEASTDNTQNETAESSTTDEYAIGEAFGTDSVEGVITELKWFTSEDIIKYSTREAGGNLTLNTDVAFPEYHVWGITGITETKLPDTSFLCVTYSLQNVGKESVEPEMESNGFGGYFLLPYGTITVIYDDGYTFDFGDDDFGKYSGFTSTLSVMGEPVNEVMIIDLPNKVYENDDKPMKLKITLPTSNGEVQEFVVNVDNIEKTDPSVYQEEAYQEAITLMDNNKYSSATEILMELQGYKDADTLLLECCVKGYEGFNYLSEHKEEFAVITDTELSSKLISTPWLKSDGETWQFFEDGTLDTGRTNPTDGTKVMWNWSVQGDTLWLGTVDKTLTVREVYDGAFVGFTEEGKVYFSMWKEQ